MAARGAGVLRPAGSGHKTPTVNGLWCSLSVANGRRAAANTHSILKWRGFAPFCQDALGFHGSDPSACGFTRKPRQLPRICETTSEWIATKEPTDSLGESASAHFSRWNAYNLQFSIGRRRLPATFGRQFAHVGVSQVPPFVSKQSTQLSVRWPARNRTSSITPRKMVC